MELVRLDTIMTGEVYSLNITEVDASNADDETEFTQTSKEPKRKKYDRRNGSD